MIFAEFPRRFYCPSCNFDGLCKWCADLGKVHDHLHACPGLAGLTIPLVPEGVKAVHHAAEREDYVGDEDVRLDGNGRPVMAVYTLRDDGVDATVYSPTATATGEANA